MPKMFENKNVKAFRSDNFNFNFNKNNGYTMTWGETKDDDPVFSPFGPMILDIEVTDICNGIGNEGPCPFCYKSNNPKNTSNMSIDMFKHIIDRMPKILTQMAIELENGEVVHLNPNEFINTKRGYIKVSELTEKDELT